MTDIHAVVAQPRTPEAVRAPDSPEQAPAVLRHRDSRSRHAETATGS